MNVSKVIVWDMQDDGDTADKKETGSPPVSLSFFLYNGLEFFYSTKKLIL